MLKKSERMLIATFFIALRKMNDDIYVTMLLLLNKNLMILGHWIVWPYLGQRKGSKFGQQNFSFQFIDLVNTLGVLLAKLVFLHMKIYEVDCKSYKWTDQVKLQLISLHRAKLCFILIDMQRKLVRKDCVKTCV